MFEINWIVQDIGTVAEFLSPEECDDYIAFAESIGFEGAPITTDQGMVMQKDVRNNDRVMVDDLERSACLFQRILPNLTRTFEKVWRPAGLNERLRLYRYDVGQKFNWHRDGFYERSNGERSFFTFLIYLNDDFEGGATSFREHHFQNILQSSVQIIPKRGMALLFNHPILHRGDPVVKGRKYVLRSDLMFARRLRAV